MLPIYHLLPPRLREKIVKEILVSLGIGSGSGVETSGERAVLELLNKKSQSALQK